MKRNKNIRSKKLIPLLILAAVSITGITVVGMLGVRHLSRSPHVSVSGFDKGATVTIDEIRQTSTRNGKVEWKLRAESGRYDLEQNQAVLTGLHVIFFTENEKEIHLSADRGILKTDSNDIEVSDNVVIKKDDMVLKARHLKYEFNRHMIFSSNPVTITDLNRRFNMTADAGEYDMEKNMIKFRGNVHGMILKNGEFEL
jgi:LPS export ABC transporter protein LptC